MSFECRGLRNGAKVLGVESSSVTSVLRVFDFLPNILITVHVPKYLLFIESFHRSYSPHLMGFVNFLYFLK